MRQGQLLQRQKEIVGALSSSEMEFTKLKLLLSPPHPTTTAHSPATTEVPAHIAAAIHLLEAGIGLRAPLTILIVAIHLLRLTALFPLVAIPLIPVPVIITLVDISTFVGVNIVGATAFRWLLNRTCRSLLAAIAISCRYAEVLTGLASLNIACRYTVAIVIYVV